MTASDIAARNHARAVALKRAHPEHGLCGGRPAFDPELGAICFCGFPLGWPPDAEEEPQVVAASVTTADAAGAQPLAVRVMDEQVVTDSNLASAVSPADPILAKLDIIDATAPYDSKMVEEHLLDAVARLERGAHYERVCAEQYADSILKYEMAHAKALLRAHKEVRGAADVRAAFAFELTENEYVERMIAKMKLDAIKGTMHSLRSVISAYQSISKSIAGAYTATRNDNGPRF